MYFCVNAVEWSSWLCLGTFSALTQGKRSSVGQKLNKTWSIYVEISAHLEHTFGALQLYNATIQDRAWFLNSKLFWSTAICTIFVIALSAGVWVGNSAAVQYVVAKSVKNFNCAIFVLVDGVWAASQIILDERTVSFRVLFDLRLYTGDVPERSVHLQIWREIFVHQL